MPNTAPLTHTDTQWTYIVSLLFESFFGRQTGSFPHIALLRPVIALFGVDSRTLLNTNAKKWMRLFSLSMYSLSLIHCWRFLSSILWYYTFFWFSLHSHNCVSRFHINDFFERVQENVDSKIDKNNLRVIFSLWHAKRKKRNICSNNNLLITYLACSFFVHYHYDGQG